jgi:molybdopterin-guanine dinucleotide biosynthesis protein A
MSDQSPVIGVLLAGGLARRMGGGDKCLLPLGGKTLLQRTIERAQPQVHALLLSANGNHLRFARSRLPVVADKYPDFPGPLAGVHAALCWMREHQPDSEWLASFACDTPFFPTDMVMQMLTAAIGANSHLAIARSKNRVHSVFALWNVSLLPKVEQLLDQGAHPRLQEWTKAQGATEVEFGSDSYDPFFNINTPQDLYAAEAQLPTVK